MDKVITEIIQRVVGDAKGHFKVVFFAAPVSLVGSTSRDNHIGCVSFGHKALLQRLIL